MKNIILIALFLVGCSDDADINRQLFVVKSRLNELETSVLFLQNKQAVSEAKYGPKVAATECVAFERNNLDTHAAGDEFGNYTIPYSGYYFVHNRIGYLKCSLIAGDIIHPKLVKNMNCPWYDKNDLYRLTTREDCLK